MNQVFTRRTFTKSLVGAGFAAGLSRDAFAQESWRTVRALSGDSLEPSPGAAFYLDNIPNPFVADSEGKVALLASPDARLVIRQDGYVPRETRVRDTLDFTLWPAQDGTFLREFAYGMDRTFGKLIRPPVGPVYVVLTGELARDAEVEAAQQRAMELATEATGGVIPFVLSYEPPVGAFVVTVSVNPALVGGGAATQYQRDFFGNYAGAKVQYKSRTIARGIVIPLHEFGHVLGVYHITQPSLMNANAGLGEFLDFTPDEKTALRMMARRPLGNTFADSDYALAPASIASALALRFSPAPEVAREEFISCNFNH